MLLCIDVGNTRIGLALIDKVRTLYYVDTKQSHLNIKEQILNFLDKNILIDDIIISSVVPSLNELLKNIFIEEYHKEPLFVSFDLITNINICIDHPEELGSDLLSVAVGTNSIKQDNKLIIDFGTATKFLVVLGNDFKGGAIAPGLIGSASSLFNNAEMLENVKLVAPLKIVGTSTMECIQSGIIIGTVSMVEKMIEKIEKEVGELKVIITGGNAEYLLESFEFDYIYKPELIFDGLVEIHKLNK